MSDTLARILEPVWDSNMDDLRQYAQEALQTSFLRAYPNLDSPMLPSSTAGHASASCTV